MKLKGMFYKIYIKKGARSGKLRARCDRETWTRVPTLSTVEMR